MSAVIGLFRFVGVKPHRSQHLVNLGQIAADPAAASSRLGRTVAAGHVGQRINCAVDGSAIWQPNAGSAGHWVSNTMTDGPLLLAAKSAIAAAATPPSFLIWSHFEQDASALTGSASDVMQAGAFLIAQLRGAIGGTATVFCDMPGPRYASDLANEWALRNALVGLVDNNVVAALFRGAEKYAVPLDATTHPTDAGYRQLGAHTGRKVYHWLTTGAELRGPQIGAVTRSGNTVSVPITTPAGAALVTGAQWAARRSCLSSEISQLSDIPSCSRQWPPTSVSEGVSVALQDGARSVYSLCTGCALAVPGDFLKNQQVGNGVLRPAPIRRPQPSVG